MHGGQSLWLFHYLLGGHGVTRTVSEMASYPALAVVASDGEGRGAVLWHVGIREIDDYGYGDLGDLGFDDAGQGISIFDGHMVWTKSPSTPDHPEEDDFELIGEYRDPTDAEWNDLRAGKNPFENRRCMHAEEGAVTDISLDGEETDSFIVRCDDVAVHDGLCEKHWRESNPPDEPTLDLDLGIHFRPRVL